MMNDINKLIEEEAERHANNIHPIEVQSLVMDSKYNWKNPFKKGFAQGANFILHQNRWRKVEEEMPEGKPSNVLVKVKDGSLVIIKICEGDTPALLNILMKAFDIIEWKPIE